MCAVSLLPPSAPSCQGLPQPRDLHAETRPVRLQRQQWRQTKRQLLQTGMLDLPASVKAAGRRTHRGAAAADLTDTDSEAEDEPDSVHPEGEDSAALTEAFRDAAPQGALLGVVLSNGVTCTRSMRL